MAEDNAVNRKVVGLQLKRFGLEADFVNDGLEALEAVYTPIGFDIGAETPEEIAVSIIAEIIAVRRRASGRPMREGRPGIGTREVQESLGS